MKSTQFLMIVLIAIGAIVGATFATISYLEEVQSNSAAETSPAASPGTSENSNPSLPSKGKDFSEFRLQLLDAIKRRDANFIKDLVDLRTQWNFGGTTNFYNSNIEDSQSMFWQYIEKAVANGCVVEPNAKVADREAGSEVWVCPETIGKPIYDSGWQEEVAILGKDVNVRSEPGTDAAILAIVSKQVIKFDPETFNNLSERMQGSVNSPDGWTPILLQNGKKGWVQNSFIYYQRRDYRISFYRQDDRWKLRYFWRGDGLDNN